ALAYLVRLYGADAAVVISASHNPMEDNGIKWFDSEGFKLSDALEDKIEALLHDHAELPRPVGAAVGRVTRMRRAAEEYRQFLLSTSTAPLTGMKLALDCANGAASGIARDVFRELGAEVTSFSDEPDGCNINARCGSTHPERLQQMVCELGADVGLAFDGDADRLIAVDELGRIVDGDRILGVCALDMQEKGMLRGDTLVVTVMSNLGFEVALRRMGGKLIRTPVGDRPGGEQMRRTGYNRGGEQSGHMIFLDHTTTGDGILSALQVLAVMLREGHSLHELKQVMEHYPQKLVNVPVAGKKPLDKIREISELQEKLEKQLGSEGRMLIRPSGTEPVVRVMVEGASREIIDCVAYEMACCIEKHMGNRGEE
ncbi:MAG: phosphoglucosamine mutase, partial [Syntrophobacteraceae bacterium]